MIEAYSGILGCDLGCFRHSFALRNTKLAADLTNFGHGIEEVLDPRRELLVFGFWIDRKGLSVLNELVLSSEGPSTRSIASSDSLLACIGQEGQLDGLFC